MPLTEGRTGCSPASAPPKLGRVMASSRVCKGCGSEFTPLYPGDVCTACGGKLLTTIVGSGPAEPRQVAKCSSCQSLITPPSNFCRRCGSAVSTDRQYCGTCGVPLIERAAFCDNCGEPVMAPLTAPVPGPPWGSTGVTPAAGHRPGPIPPPTLTATILVTFFFGAFGLIPAVIHASRARDLGYNSARYWWACGLTFLLAVLLTLIFLLVIVHAASTSAAPGSS
ncbi:MAG: double zinc ribbon domain-containing protein [Acidimicrobiales bacterium]